MANSEAATIDAIEVCCAHIEAMCAALDEVDWHRPTALRGWDIQDVVAHLGSLDGMLLGRHEDEHEAPPADHVRNPLGALNERLVDRRRAWPGAAVLAEFREVSRLRLAQLRALSEEELAEEVPSPRGGTMPQGRFVGVRLWDFVVHDMDVAEALRLAYPVDNPASTRVLDEMLSLLPRAVARGGLADGDLVTVEISAPLPRTASAVAQAGRGRAVSATAGEAALHLRASPTAFLRVGAGRRVPFEAINAGMVEVSGDRDAAASVLTALNVVP